MKPLLEVSALLLGIVNAFFLLRFYLRDRAKLQLKPVGGDTFQWWFTLPGREYDGHPTRRFQFLTYFGVSNSGLRGTAMVEWKLVIKDRFDNEHILSPNTLPPPVFKTSEYTKVYKVFGLVTEGLHGTTWVDSGDSVSGFAYYSFEVWGDTKFDPQEHGGKIEGTIQIKDAFGRKSRLPIVFDKKTLEEVKEFIPNIDQVRTD